MSLATAPHAPASAPRPAQPIRLYHSPFSGHAHRARLFLSLLDLPVELQTVDLVAGQHKQPEFLALNPFGQVPVMQDGDMLLADSAAILVYLAKRYDASGTWLPQDPVGAARVQRWLSVAAGQLVNGPGAAWVNSLYGRPTDDAVRATAARLLGLMDAHLAQQPWLASTAHPTIADIAMHSYTVLAPAGGIALDAYPHVLAWIARIEALPGFIRQRGAPELKQAA